MKQLVHVIIAWSSMLALVFSLTPGEKILKVRPESDTAWTGNEKKIIAQVRKLLEAEDKIAFDARYRIEYSKTGGRVWVVYVKGYYKGEIEVGGHCTVLLNAKLAPVKILKGL